MTLWITTHCWGQRYGREYVNRLSAGVRRNLRTAHRFVVIADGAANRGFIQTAWEIPKQDFPLLTERGCFCRLRMFSPDWQASHGIKPGDRIVSLDLDMVITGRLEPLFDREESFVILQGANAANPCPFNGSVFMLRAGTHSEIWSEFSLDAAKKTKFHTFPDDQGWLWDRIPKAAGWQVGPTSGIFGFQKPGWPGGDELPSSARIVSFFGKRDPAQFVKLPWVRKYWLGH